MNSIDHGALEEPGGSGSIIMLVTLSEILSLAEEKKMAIGSFPKIY